MKGNFESPSVREGVAVIEIPADWSFSGSAGYLVSDGGNASLPPAAAGNQLFYFFSGSLSQGGIGLSAGQTYELTFDLSRFAGLNGAVSATVSDGVDSQTMNFSVSSNAWSSESWSFTAGDTGVYTLTLAAGADDYPAVDQVALGEYSAVPEPAGNGVYIGVSAVALAAVRRRKISRVRGDS